MLITWIMPPQQKDLNASTWVPKFRSLNLYLGNWFLGLSLAKYAAHTVHWTQQRLWLLSSPENKVTWILYYSA